jgi:hypothetical protein
MANPVHFESLMVCMLNSQRMLLQEQNIDTFYLDINLATHRGRCLSKLRQHLSEPRNLLEDSSILSLLCLMSVDVS